MAKCCKTQRGFRWLMSCLANTSCWQAVLVEERQKGGTLDSDHAATANCGDLTFCDQVA